MITEKHKVKFFLTNSEQGFSPLNFSNYNPSSKLFYISPQFSSNEYFKEKFHYKVFFNPP